MLQYSIDSKHALIPTGDVDHPTEWGSSWCERNNCSQTRKLINGEKLLSPFIDPHDWNPIKTSKRDVGCGKLFHGGSDGPMGSVVLATIRDGIEDIMATLRCAMPNRVTLRRSVFSRS